jgi:hypothetical protein
METTQVSFIRGFVEKCASKGWKPDQISDALGVLQLNEMFQDPAFRSGFDKQAAGFMDSLKNMTPGQTAALGAGVGGLGGLVFGGKNRLRNALIGALGGGAVGYGVGKYRDFKRDLQTDIGDDRVTAGDVRTNPQLPGALATAKPLDALNSSDPDAARLPSADLRTPQASTYDPQALRSAIASITAVPR